MPGPISAKRVKGKRISRHIIIGSEAFTLPPVGDSSRPKGIPDDHTKRWTVYVRQPEGDPDIRAWLNKVQFKIFNTYENPLRTCENPPFEVTETGWGGFTIDIRLHFQSISGEKPQYRQHFLQLEKYGDEAQQEKQEREGLVRSEFLEIVQFNEPTETLWDALTSENQWDYLMKGGKKAANPIGSNGRPKRGFQGGERSAQLPERGENFSQEQEDMLVNFLKEKQAEIDKKTEENNQARVAIEHRLKELRERVGPDAAQQASQQASGDRARRR